MTHNLSNQIFQLQFQNFAKVIMLFNTQVTLWKKASSHKDYKITCETLTQRIPEKHQQENVPQSYLPQIIGEQHTNDKMVLIFVNKLVSNSFKEIHLQHDLASYEAKYYKILA